LEQVRGTSETHLIITKEMMRNIARIEIATLKHHPDVASGFDFMSSFKVWFVSYTS